MRNTTILVVVVTLAMCPALLAQTITEQWAEVIAEASYDDLSPEVVERVKYSLLDSIAVMLFTSSLEESGVYVAKPLANGGAPEATVWGIGRELPVEAAADLNSFLVHGHEISDSDFRSGMRISCVTLAPTLTVADYTHASGEELILATAIAYTLTGRMAAVVPSTQWMGFMPSGIWGPGGAAAGASRLLGLDREQTANALGLAIGGGQGSFQYFYDQTQDKKVIVGRAGRIGVEAALLASRGWTGARKVVEGPGGIYHGLMKGYFNANELRTPIEQGLADLIPAGVQIADLLIDFQPNFEALVENFDQFEGPLYVYPKFHACSASIGPFLDALDPLWEKTPVDVDDIDHVVVGHAWPIESEMAQKVLHFSPPQTVVGAQLNMNFMVSLYLHKGSASPHDVVEEALADPGILDLARRVTIEQVPAGADLFLRVVRRDGSDLTATFRLNLGREPESLMRDLRLKKFRTLTRDVLDDDGRQRLFDLVMKVDEVKDVSSWTDKIHALLAKK
jgi:2-methylcitrate dehydratase PrpD